MSGLDMAEGYLTHTCIHVFSFCRRTNGYTYNGEQGMSVNIILIVLSTSSSNFQKYQPLAIHKHAQACTHAHIVFPNTTQTHPFTDRALGYTN